MQYSHHVSSYLQLLSSSGISWCPRSFAVGHLSRWQPATIRHSTFCTVQPKPLAIASVKRQSADRLLCLRGQYHVWERHSRQTHDKVAHGWHWWLGGHRSGYWRRDRCWSFGNGSSTSRSSQSTCFDFLCRSVRLQCGGRRQGRTDRGNTERRFNTVCCRWCFRFVVVLLKERCCNATGDIHQRRPGCQRHGLSKFRKRGWWFLHRLDCRWRNWSRNWSRCHDLHRRRLGTSCCRSWCHESFWERWCWYFWQLQRGFCHSCLLLGWGSCGKRTRTDEQRFSLWHCGLSNFTGHAADTAGITKKHNSWWNNKINLKK